MKKLIFALTGLTAFIVVHALAEEEEAPLAPLEAGSVSQEDGLANWAKIHEVFSHPRCANCHVDDSGIPMWSGPSYGKTRPHGMFISGGETRIGIEFVQCGTCHGRENSPTPHGPPGNEVWLLAPAEMQWFDKSSQEICEQIKDPERNGGRTILEVAEHVSHDPLVHWGWDPGPGREAAPYSAAETTDSILKWQAAGAPCPSAE